MRASLFITCYNDTLFPETGHAVVRLLERLGVDIDFHPKQTCCGQMHANTGFRGEAFSQAKRFVCLYQEAETVVIPSSSCVAMIRDQYPSLFAELGNETIRQEFAALLPRVYELSEFLIDRLGVEDVGAYFPHRVTFHPTCHSQRMLRIGDAPERLLRKVRGIDLVELPQRDECCGFGGTFSVKNADTSIAMLSDKIRCVLETKAEYCAAADNSCLMHIGGALHRGRSGVRSIHIAEILAASAARGERHS